LQRREYGETLKQIKMENIGDWLYIVILVIAGIASIISSFNKKNKENAKQELPREITPGDIFDDEFWGNETANKQQPVPVVKPKSKSKVKKQDIFEAKHKDYRFHQQQEGVSAITSTSAGTVFADIEDDYTPITLEDLPSNTDEWRKALIYNEIINRKY
jgi:hypothetical protein